MIETGILGVFWLVILCFIMVRASKTRKNRPGQSHPTTVNKPSSPLKKTVKVPGRTTVSDDGHKIPRSRDITCEGQYGHDHGNREPRYIVHEEATEGYCILNGKKVALKDCWKY